MLLDKNWHQVCHVWSSRTFFWAFYVDGKKGNSGLHAFRATAGCALYLGAAHVPTSANRLLLSQVNLWDRVLTSQEISEHSETCNAGVGNVRSWAGLYKKNEQTLYSKPSSCKTKNSFPTEAPPRVTTKATTPTTASTTAAAGDQPTESPYLRSRPNKEKF